MMTAPITFQPKSLVNVVGVFNDGTDEATQAIVSWVTPYLLEEEQIIVNWPAQVSIFGGSLDLTVPVGNYLFLDEDGFHVASKGAFEMLYKETSGVV